MLHGLFVTITVMWSALSICFIVLWTYEALRGPIAYEYESYIVNSMALCTVATVFAVPFAWVGILKGLI